MRQIDCVQIVKTAPGVTINYRRRDHRILVFLVKQGPSGERKKVVNGKMHDKEHDKQNANVNVWSFGPAFCWAALKIALAMLSSGPPKSGPK